MYDIRELQGQQDDEDRLVSPLVGSLERERGVLVDDPRWQGEGSPFSLCGGRARSGWGGRARAALCHAGFHGFVFCENEFFSRKWIF